MEVELQQFGRPAGQWHAKAETNGFMVWAASFREAPPEVKWFARWTPSTAGGYVAMTDVIVEPVRGEGHLALGHYFSRAGPSDDVVGHQGRVHVAEGVDADEWVLSFAVEAFEAEGNLELLVQWDSGQSRRWNPVVEAEGSPVEIEEHPLVSGSALMLEATMTGFRGLHVVIPCAYEERPGSERLSVEIGGAEPNHWREDGEREESEFTDWTSYVGFWTYDAPSAPVRVEYEGESPPTVAIIRSTTDAGEILRDALGYTVWLAGSSPHCVVQPPGP